MRVIVHFLDGGFVNVSADTIDKQDEWIMVRSGSKLVGMFDEGSVKCAYMSQKGDKKDDRKDRTQTKD